MFSCAGTAGRAAPGQIRVRMALTDLHFHMLSALRSRWKKVCGGGHRDLGSVKEY